MPVRLTILGSGSSGNCAYVETDETRILIDAGFSLRQIRQRLATIGRTPENLTGILITHEHADHTHGLEQICEKLHIPVYCNRPTAEAIEYQLKLKFDCRLFTTGAAFEVGELHVETFSIPHDAQDPVGYLVHTAAGRLGFLTDLGHTNRMILERVRTANVLVLESNHDVQMLQDCPHRPWSLKQRILGRHGHLSNESAAEAAEQIMSADLRHLYLGHLSRQCNKPELAVQVMQKCLTQIGASHVRLELTSQSTPCPTLSLEDKAAEPVEKSEVSPPEPQTNSVTAQVAGRSVPERRDDSKGTGSGRRTPPDGGPGRTALPKKTPKPNASIPQAPNSQLTLL